MKNTTRLLALCVAAVLLLTAAVGCGKDEGKKTSSTTTTTESTKNTKPTENTQLTDCTVTITTQGGAKLQNVGVGIYADLEQNDIIDFARTDANGAVALNATIPAGSYIFLTDVPQEYSAEAYYTIEQKDTTITLSTDSVILGEMMADFTVTDGNGTEYTLSTLLDTKKAVVLNFWYTNCGPCVLEFPYLQQAYDEYKDSIALLALDPIDNAEAVAAFAAEHGLTFPMMACDDNWAQKADIVGYPTTIIIDRFGIVSLIHCGGIDSSNTFKNLFAYFTAEDYVKGTFDSIRSFLGEDKEPSSTSPSTTVTTESSTTTTATTTTTKPTTTTSTTGSTTVTTTTKVTSTTTKPIASTNGTTTTKATTTTTKATTTTTKPTTGTTATKPTINTNGTLINADSPIEYGGQAAMSFSAEVKAGEMVLFNLFRISGTTLHIADANAYVIYLNQTYTPDKDGNIYVPVTSNSPSNPIVVKIGNSGQTDKTFAINCSFPEGSLMNPYKAKAGTIKTELVENNDQGVYYTCVATKNGTMTIELKSVTANVLCDIVVTVVDSNFIPHLHSFAESVDGKTLTIDISEGEEIRISIVALPDENYKYPAATVETVLSFS